ncbi:hypothetical protein [Marinobacter sp. DY40_1A1]|uniref:hypothetical protein n=1 Tax=Marinobacter sp. DY40_1A1 TaxID=2583229 RepID=UPI001D118F4A|nr:hypothetical protein [Marinobacter sp. DY40_1A1]
MKWLALVLVVINFCVWQLSDYSKVASQPGSAVSGSLPRVTSLKVQKNAVVASEPVSNEWVCVRVGWIKSVEVAEALGAHSVFSRTQSLSLEKVERPLPSLHWVIIPPQPPTAALEQFRDMQRRGVDSYLVTEGENRNAISLGLFESRSAAISVLEEKKRKNFNVVLVNFDRNQISYALAFEAESNLVEEMVQAVEADYGEEFDFVEVNRCEGVATRENNP